MDGHCLMGGLVDSLVALCCSPMKGVLDKGQGQRLMVSSSL